MEGLGKERSNKPGTCDLQNKNGIHVVHGPAVHAAGMSHGLPDVRVIDVARPPIRWSSRSRTRFRRNGRCNGGRAWESTRSQVWLISPSPSDPQTVLPQVLSCANGLGFSYLRLPPSSQVLTSGLCHSGGKSSPAPSRQRRRRSTKEHREVSESRSLREARAFG